MAPVHHPTLLLRRDAVVEAYPDEFRVILPTDDSFDPEVGTVAKRIGVGQREFWQWSSPGHRGQAASREEAMASIKETWSATSDELGEIRRDQEWTANK